MQVKSNNPFDVSYYEYNPPLPPEAIPVFDYEETVRRGLSVKPDVGKLTALLARLKEQMLNDMKKYKYYSDEWHKRSDHTTTDEINDPNLNLSVVCNHISCDKSWIIALEKEITSRQV
jgi:hypothetical protein